VQEQLLWRLDSVPQSLKREYETATDHGLYSELHKLERMTHEAVPVVRSLTRRPHRRRRAVDTTNALLSIVERSIELVRKCHENATCVDARRTVIETTACWRMHADFNEDTTNESASVACSNVRL